MLNKLTLILTIGIFIVLSSIPIVGYVLNIVKISQCEFSLDPNVPHKEEIFRGIGVIFPLFGVIEGFINFDRDGKINRDH